MNVQKKEKVEDLLERLMGGEEGEIVEDSFDKIEKQEQDQNLLWESVCKKKKEFVGEKNNNEQTFVMI